jgi:uncharacterized protein YraI
MAVRSVQGRLLPVLALAAFACAQPVPAKATTYCYVSRTPDGFVALRAGPGAAAGLVTRMRAGEEVLLEPGRSGTWRQVHLMRRTGRDDGYFGPGHPGWMHSRYIERCY